MRWIKQCIACKFLKFEIWSKSYCRRFPPVPVNGDGNEVKQACTRCWMDCGEHRLRFNNSKDGVKAITIEELHLDSEVTELLVFNGFYFVGDLLGVKSSHFGENIEGFSEHARETLRAALERIEIDSIYLQGL